MKNHYNLINRVLLENHLADSACRRGISAYRLGLIPQGISDHLPIKILIRQEKTTVNIISWNMLADAHLYNNFMNITGTVELLAAINKKDKNNIYGGNEGFNRLYHYFSELAQFLYDNKQNDTITLDCALLQTFNSLNYESKLTPTRDSLDVQQSRADIAKILLDSQQEDAHEFKLAIQHSVDLIYHIQNDLGVLKWKNRLNRLKENKALISTLAETDFLCLQECTHPADIETLFPQKKSLVYRINKTTTDHCALFYNASKFQQVGEALFLGLDKGKKPCIMARFKNIEHGNEFIVGSVHHPGGKESLIHELLEKKDTLLQEPTEQLEFFLPGDYNHSKAFFDKDTHSSYDMLYPELGTMAGADYGNTNQSIDALLTNMNSDHIKIECVKDMSMLRAANMPLRVHFKKNNTYIASASPSFEPLVQAVVSHDEAEDTIDILGQNDAVYAPRMAF